MRHRRFGIALASALLAACVSSELTLAPPEEAGVTMRGVVRDWKNGLAVSGATVSTVGIAPPTQAVAGSDGSFVLEDLPASGFVILEVVAEGRLRTFSPAMLIGSVDLEGVDAPSIAMDDGASIYAGFGVVSSSGSATFVGRVALCDVPGGIDGISSIQVSTSPDTKPRFLDGAGVPLLGATVTNTSGAFAFLNLSPGAVMVTATNATYSFDVIAAPAEAGAWSVVELSGLPIEPGATPTPAPLPQSFSTNIRPIFTSRGCQQNDACHRGANPDGAMELSNYRTNTEIFTQVSPRVNRLDPPASLLLQKPLFESNPNHQGGNIFLTTADADYQRILQWIAEGAANN